MSRPPLVPSPVSSATSPPLLRIDTAALPPLPLAADSQLAQQAFTHTSDLSGQASSTRRARLESSQRLEWLGDAALFFLVSQTLEQLLPTATVGELSRLRSQLTSNRVFAKLAKLYNLEQYVLATAVRSFNDPRRDEKLLADTFEALVGAAARAEELSLSGAPSPGSTKAFVQALISPAVFPVLGEAALLLEQQADEKRGQTGGGTGMLLHDLLPPLSPKTATTAESSYQWLDSQLDPVQTGGVRGWQAALVLHGRELARATAKNKALARGGAFGLFRMLFSTQSPL
ncbi:hypothetical protein JCM10207_004883 [Rhodosporidiobolus poonsookiae]